MSSSVWTRVLSGLGACVAAFLVFVYGIALLIAGMPDEEVSTGGRILFVAKLVVVGGAGAALFAAAVGGRRWAVLCGCSLYLTDFGLWLVWHSRVLEPVTPENPVPGPVAQPPVFWLVLVTVWVVLPALLAAVAFRRPPENVLDHHQQLRSGEPAHFDGW